ncbi:hypothetical protein V757_10615 [Pelistega indica]|uniref:Uncharacterized protein n=1 Tax=Pelistega indica TaxID=1414851 RepID=V8FUU3_9BURK|nr:hypothetical protein V757_10615 [Pelistega indica]
MIDHALKIEKIITLINVILLVFMILMVFVNVVLRYGFNSGISVSVEISSICFCYGFVILEA